MLLFPGKNLHELISLLVIRMRCFFDQVMKSGNFVFLLRIKWTISSQKLHNIRILPFKSRLALSLMHESWLSEVKAVPILSDSNLISTFLEQYITQWRFSLTIKATFRVLNLFEVTFWTDYLSFIILHHLRWYLNYIPLRVAHKLIYFYYCFSISEQIQE